MREALAQGVVGNSLLGKPARKKISLDIARQWPFMHLGVAGPAKVGKTDMALRARTHEVRTPDKMKGFDVVSKGEVVIPSKPLAIAFANFDRDARSVFANLPADSDITEEDFYLDSDGFTPLIALDVPTMVRLLERLDEFLNDAEPTSDLVMVDGGTILWDDVRSVRMAGILPGGKDGDGQARHLPRQYAPANEKMRNDIMQRIYNLNCHTYLTQEVRAVWLSQNETMKGADGKEVVTFDGWNKTGHYVDIHGLMRIAAFAEGTKRVFKAPEVHVNIAQLGVDVKDPSFAGLYKAAYGLPLLKKEDRELFDKLEEEHGRGRLSF